LHIGRIARNTTRIIP